MKQLCNKQDNLPLEIYSSQKVHLVDHFLSVVIPRAHLKVLFVCVWMKA